MALLDVVTKKNEVLRAETTPVKNIKDPELQTLIDDMIETMREQKGVGLAAPQIGRSERFCVIETLPKVDEDGEEIEGTRELYVVFNPKVLWRSRKKVTGIEGCLSIPGYLGEVERNFAIIVQAWDRHGRKKRWRLKGWDARIFQHEIDHMNGILYTDKLTAPENFWTEEAYKEMQEAQEAAEEEARKAAEEAEKAEQKKKTRKSKRKARA